MSSSATELRETSIAWVGRVPAHWTPMRLKDTVEGCVNGIWGDDPVGDELDTPVIRVADFDRNGRLANEYQTLRSVQQNHKESRILEPHDLLIEKSGGGEQQPVGMVVEYQGHQGAVCSNFVARMRPREFADSRYLTYLHAHLYERSITTLSIKQSTGIQNLDSAAYLAEKCFVPPIDEQIAIAAYLDAETKRINELIDEKLKLKALLKEWRLSVVWNAVTKGVGAPKPCSPSGVPWLGNVPAHWSIEKLKFFVTFAGGGTPSKSDDSYWTGNIPWVSPKDMKRPIIGETEDYITETGLVSSPCTLIPPFSVLTVVRSGILQHSIPVALNSVPVTLNQDMKAMIPDERVDSRYLAYQISGCQKELREAWVKQGATVESIEHQTMANSLLSVPPIEEQRQIVDYLDVELLKIDQLVTHVDNEIEVLAEFRSSIIADAVLGRIDVRKVLTH